MTTMMHWSPSPRSSISIPPVEDLFRVRRRAQMKSLRRSLVAPAVEGRLEDGTTSSSSFCQAWIRRPSRCP